MVQNNPVVNFDWIFSAACELPYCRIDRGDFLTRELRNRINPAQFDDALKNGIINDFGRGEKRKLSDR